MNPRLEELLIWWLELGQLALVVSGIVILSIFIVVGIFYVIDNTTVDFPFDKAVMFFPILLFILHLLGILQIPGLPPASELLGGWNIG